MLMKGSNRSKGLGNKIDPSKGSSCPPSSSPDLTACLSDELLLCIFSCMPQSPYPCSLVCKRWLKLHGLLVSSVRIHDWSFLESGRMAHRFPNLTDVDLTEAWLSSPKQSSVVFTHRFITVHLGTDAYDPLSIERFIEEQQLPVSAFDKGLKALAEGSPGLQRLCVVDVRRPSYNSWKREQVTKNDLVCQKESIGRDATGIGKQVSDCTIITGDSQNGNDEMDLTNTKQSSKTENLCNGGIAYVAKMCPTLQELVLNQCTDESLSVISACKNLQILRLVGKVSGFYHCTFTDIGLTILAKGCSRLVKLELSGCEASYDGIAAIGQCCFMLEELTLTNHGFSEGWLAALSYCSCLKTLRLEGCKQIDPIPGPTEHLSSCASLERLELVRCCARDRAGFLALMQVCKNVKELCFQDCWGLDDETFHLVEICRHVRLLSLEGCSLVTTGGLEAVVVNWKDLHSLQVVYCNSLKDSEISIALASTFSTLKELKWRPNTRLLLTDNLMGTGVGQIGGKFFKRGA